jgi:flavin-dependent dehydrogenase
MKSATNLNLPASRGRPDLRDVVNKTWDVVVIGAGVAGSVTAALLAERGKRVLVLEKSHWPREKVCGGCLSSVAVQMLKRAGLGSALRRSQPIDRAVWQVGGQSIDLPTAGGAAISRSDLDAALVSCAVDRGCTFVPGVAAKLLPSEDRDSYRSVQLKIEDSNQTVLAKVVLACDGIAGTSMEAENWSQWKIARRAWMGVSVTFEDRNAGPIFAAHRSGFRTGSIHMHIGNGGYVGVVRMQSGNIHLAAALDPARGRDEGGPASLVRNILNSCGQTRLPDFQNLRLRGAGTLTRRRLHLGGHRVLAVGDACGYIEPFTGEGMAWAIRAAIAVVDVLPEMEDWPANLAEQWGQIHRNLIQRKQRWCAALRPLVHRPALAALAVTAGRAVPAIGQFLALQISPSDLSTPQGDFA